MKLSDLEDPKRFETVLEWREHGDGTADVSRDGGKTWTRERFPLALPDGRLMAASGYIAPRMVH